MRLNRTGMVIVIVIGVAFGFDCLPKCVSVFGVRNAPIVSGLVISRTPCRRQGVPSTDFTIRVEDTAEVVHAYTGRSIINKVPSTVRFHYSGDPSKGVFLFEHQQNPFWLLAIAWGTSLMCLIALLARLKESR